MNREDIIRMAQETGVTAERVRDLVNFDSLVASAEREACAKICDEFATEDGWEGGYAYRCVEAIRARGQA